MKKEGYERIFDRVALPLTMLVLVLLVVGWVCSALSDESSLRPAPWREFPPPQAGLYYARVYKEATGQHSSLLRWESEQFMVHGGHPYVATECFWIVSFNEERLRYYYEKDPPEARVMH